MTSASLCSSNDTLRELSLADNGKKKMQTVDWHPRRLKFQPTEKTFQGCGLLGTVVQKIVKSLFLTLFPCQTQIIKRWHYKQLIKLT